VHWFKFTRHISPKHICSLIAEVHLWGNDYSYFVRKEIFCKKKKLIFLTDSDLRCSGLISLVTILFLMLKVTTLFIKVNDRSPITLLLPALGNEHHSAELEETNELAEPRQRLIGGYFIPQTALIAEKPGTNYKINLCTFSI
jgi:hypothetical protein